jgi:hypothetical protein
MSKEQITDLVKFLKPYPREVKDIVLWLRTFVWDLYPKTNELIYDNYNAVAIGWSPSEKVGHTFCSIAAAPRYAHFGFYWGSELSDPQQLLLGKGKQYRYIIVHNTGDFPEAYIKQLMKEAYKNSLSKLKPGELALNGATITKSISPVKKRPGSTPVKKKK